MNPNLDLFVQDLPIGVRLFNCLKKEGLFRVRDITQRSDRDMLKIKGLGRHTLEELKTVLGGMGLSLWNPDPDEDLIT